MDATYARLVEAGYEGKKAPFDAFWGQRYANVVDPDGNVVDLFAALWEVFLVLSGERAPHAQ